MEGIKGKDAPNYREKVGKVYVHQWLSTNYGKENICEEKACTGKSIWYDWALIHGKQYERKRGNFKRLCRSCHRRYDLTKEKIEQAKKNLWWARGIKNPMIKNNKK